MENKNSINELPLDFMNILKSIKTLREMIDDYFEDEKDHMKHLTNNEFKERIKPISEADNCLWMMIDYLGQYAGYLIADNIKKDYAQE